MRSKRISVLVLALLCAAHLAWATSGIASAEVFDEYSIAVGQWAKPIYPDTVLNTNRVILGLTASDMVTIMAMRDLDGEAPSRADFTGYCEGFAEGFFAEVNEDQDLADVETVLPESFDDSLGYWAFKEGTGSISIICSRHDNDALYVFLLLSSDKDPETTQALLADIASDVLNTDSPYPTSSSLESLISGFSDNRPMTDLPGRNDLPTGFQFIDKDYLVMD